MTASRADVQSKLDVAESALGDVSPNITLAMSQIIAAREEVGMLVDPPPPPPPATFDPDPFTWSAPLMTVDPNSAALVKAFLSYGIGSGIFIMPKMAYGVLAADGSIAEYGVATAGKPGHLDGTIYIPVGLGPSLSADHSVRVVDWKRGRQHDLWRTTFTNGKLTGWQAGCSIAIHAIQEPIGNNYDSNGAGINGLAGILHPEQILAHDLSHPIVFSCVLPGPTPNRYPAANTGKGWPNPGHLPAGSMLRLPPDLVLPSMPVAETHVCLRAQARGWILSDQNTYDMSFKGADRMGNGASRAMWLKAGVDLGTNWAHKLAIPSSVLSKLQLLVPPSL